MTQLLDKQQVKQKINRIAIELLEHNSDVTTLVLAGINNNGMRFARQLEEVLQRLAPQVTVLMANIKLNPANPLTLEVQVLPSVDVLQGKSIVIVDDVANTGRTIFYALKPLMGILPAKVEVAVLVDRKHKLFPIHCDYVGMTLATTVDENIQVHITDESEYAVYLT
jgi:pyrimidine operon attenuation protein/uracil phosphoribosyltransferase